MIQNNYGLTKECFESWLKSVGLNNIVFSIKNKQLTRMKKECLLFIHG